MFSLRARLLIAASLVLALFFGITGLTLDHAYSVSAEQALKDRLRGDVNALVAASEQGEDGITRLTNALPEVRFFIPGSDLFAFFMSNDGQQMWRSPSMESLSIPFPSGLGRGETLFRELNVSDGTVVQVYSLGVTWDATAGPHGGYTFSVAEDLNDHRSRISGFRQQLWGWLAAVAIMLLAVQGTILRWSLTPLRRAADDLALIEQGKQTELAGRYPAELRPLTDNINALIESSRAHLERYRHRLGDLAHSLKTPLAVLRGAVEDRNGVQELADTVQEQVDRMSRTVDYQLRRAAASGGTVLGSPVNVEQIARKVAGALDKVYSDKGVVCEVQVDPACEFHGDESDLFEVIGNLLDNAYKWCRHRVDVRAAADGAAAGRAAGLMLIVEDDGPGISAAAERDVRRRGVRAESAEGGHGIGLAIVDDIVRIYGGKFEIGAGPLGGARITVVLPRR